MQRSKHGWHVMLAYGRVKKAVRCKASIVCHGRPQEPWRHRHGKGVRGKQVVDLSPFGNRETHVCIFLSISLDGVYQKGKQK